VPLRHRSHLNSEGGLPMGRGRSKAKQTKVARDLKYSNQEMDLERLAKELHGELDSNKKGTHENSYSDEDNLKP
jgi:Protein of unknown function (DUF3073)